LYLPTTPSLPPLNLSYLCVAGTACLCRERGVQSLVNDRKNPWVSSYIFYLWIGDDLFIELKKILYPCGVVVPVIEDDLDEVEVRVEVEIDGPDQRQKEQE
jgi:hypothetical protein